MANQEHLNILAKAVPIWNAWREENRLIFPPDLRKANFSFSYLRNADLSHCLLSQADIGDCDLRDAKLSDADLTGAYLQNVDLASADLARADLSQTRLVGANLSWTRCVDTFFVESDLLGADLSGSDLSDADLTKADLIGCDLRFATFRRNSLFETDFHEATFGETSIADCNLGDAKDLEFANHRGPSSIDISTIYKSGGNIPEKFLHGCGVPDSFVAQMHRLVSDEGVNRFYSSFISYSSKDDGFARKLHSRMRDAHLRVWYASEDAQGGKKLHEQIDAAIQQYDKLVIVLSAHSLQSEWVKTELRKAFKFERRTGRRKLFPVRLVDFSVDADSGKDLAIELREYLISDFCGWREDWQFEAAFSRLLKDLRADEGQSTGSVPTV